MPKKSVTLDFQEPARFHTATEGHEPDRVRRNTAQQVQVRIDADTHEAIKLHSGLGHAAISLRLKELDKEWPVDRARIPPTRVPDGPGDQPGANRLEAMRGDYDNLS